jgi:hypothetical protein
MDITLKLTLDEVNGILAVLGDLPTKTNAWVLMKKVEEQAKEQVPQEPGAADGK